MLLPPPPLPSSCQVEVDVPLTLTFEALTICLYARFATLFASIASSLDSLKHFKLLSISSMVLFSNANVVCPIVSASEYSSSTLKKN